MNCVNQKINIIITRIINPYMHLNILAEFIAEQLKNRISFRKARKKAIELTEQTDTKGIQGRVPLQTIRANIDYCSYTVRTIYGVLGKFFWIFIDED
ncbi:unnamed protein product [Linum tenue]|uniref:Ribosomal protein S3 n=1 Tax=Linum tenue TaxID=586396 RepID=A0AAV0MI51_9ROSI|nr:unnamed protein product [Linum tenue]